MSIDRLKSSIPDFAKDIRLNLSSLATDETLTPRQKYGLLLACGIASRNAAVRTALAAEAGARLPPAEVDAARSAAAIMGMNNVYYRFLHLTAHGEFKTMPARLRMTVLANPGVDNVDFELWCLAVSIVNGCGQCIDAHIRTLREAGVSAEVIQCAARFAAIVQAVAVALEADTAQ